MRPAILSFYSYKGGVGRTLLAANMAVAFARQGKTLLWDLDVEAPGLHHIQALRPASGPVKSGFFDWLTAWQRNQQRQPGAKDLQRFDQLPCATPFRNLYILPAHGDDADPAALYFGIDWALLLSGDPPPARGLFRELFDHLGTQGFRHVLIDSRTGLTDLGALIAGVLPDATVLVGGYGAQNLRGLGRVHRSLAQLSPTLRDRNTALRLFPVASPIPQHDAGKVEAGRKLWREAFGQDLAAIHEIRYEPELAFSESLLITQPERTIAQDYERLHRSLADFVDTVFAEAAAEQAERQQRPDQYGRNADTRHSRSSQGKRFEERVADLLRLLGYSVEPEQLVGPDRVDLIARIESGLDTLTYLVECKDHRDAVGKDIVDLLGLWLSKPAAQALHARGMIVARAFSPAALTSAKALNITAITPQDLERRLLAFESYLHQILADFERSPLARSYVDQYVRAVARQPASGEQAPPKPEAMPLLEQGVAWASGRGSRLWVLLGDYGTGKTAFTEKLCYELAKRAREDTDAPVPLRVSLREFPNKVRLEELLAERWLQATGQRKDPRVLLHLVQRGRIVLIFDAFDEMGIATAGRSVIDQFRMLVSLTANAGDGASSNRVLITCREQFFKDHGDAMKTVAGNQDRLAPLEDLTQHFDGSIQTLATFTPEQVHRFLALRLDEAGGDAALRFLREHNLLELGDRPQLLDLIIASLPELQQRKASTGAPLSVGELYRAYTNRWLDDFRPVERQSSSEGLRTVLEELAHVLWQRVGHRIHHGDLYALLQRRGELRGQLDPDRLDVELRTAAFLSRTPDGLYGFSHRSFLEFFLARRIERAACAATAPGELASTLDLPRLSAECSRFLHDLVPLGDAKRRDTLRSGIRTLLSPQTAPPPLAARVNALLLGYRLAGLEHTRATDPSTKAAQTHEERLRECISAWIPPQAQLAGADLSELSLIFLEAPGIDLRGADLRDCDLGAARLPGAQLSRARLWRAKLHACDLSGACLDQADASDSQGPWVVLTRASARDSIWVNAELPGASVSETDFSAADLRAARLAACKGSPILTDARLHSMTAVAATGWPEPLMSLCRPNVQTLVASLRVGHFDEIDSVAFSPDGTRLLSGGAYGRLCLWDAASGQLLWVVEGHARWVASVAFSPDGRRLLSGGADGRLCLWDAISGQSLRVIKGHAGWIRSAVFSPDGSRVLSGGDDGQLCLWDAASGQPLQVIKGHKPAVWSVAISPDGTRLLSGGRDGRLCLWDAASGQALQIIEERKRVARSVAFSPDGTRLLSGGDDGRLYLWDAASGKSLWVIEGHSRWVTSIAFSNDGTRLLSGGIDHRLCLWDAASGQALLEIATNKSWVLSVAFSPDGTRLLSSDDDQRLCLWDATNGQSLRVIEGKAAEIQSVAFGPDGRRLLSSGRDGQLYLWDIASKRLQQVIEGHAGWVGRAAFSPDGVRLLSGGRDGRLCLWDATSGETLQVIKKHRDWIRSVAFSHDGTCLLSGGDDGRLCLWDATGKLLQEIKGHARGVSSVAFSPDGRLLLSGGGDTRLCLWDAATGQALQVIDAHKDRIDSVAFSPNGRRLLSGGGDSRLCLWDATTGQALQVIEAHRDQIQSVAFSPDGTRLLSGGSDGRLCVWDAASGKPLRVIEGHAGGVTSVAFSPDGTSIAAGCGDGSICMYDDTRLLFRAYAERPATTPSEAAATRAIAANTASTLRAGRPDNWVVIDYRKDPRGLWRGAGPLLHALRYHDPDEAPEGAPWIPRLWHAVDLPELRASEPAFEGEADEQIEG